MTTDPLLNVEDLRIYFRRKTALSRTRTVLRAVDGVDIQVGRGETVGLVGESGSGKSTLARGVLRLVDVESGSIEFNGEELAGQSRHKLQRVRRNMQMVFQDPYSSLDPSMVISDIIGEPVDVYEKLGRTERRDLVREALRRVGLSDHHLERYPYEFSGGQRQRIAIGRALVLEPQLVVLDEPVSALDASTQSQIVNLLSRLQAEIGVSYLFIAHDLAVVRHISQRIAVMYLGRIVEEGPAERVYNEPCHPYTVALLSAIPYPHPARQAERERIVLHGDPPSPLNPPTGCRFHTRCPFVMDICRELDPTPTAVAGGGSAACHLHDSGPALGGASVLVLPRSQGRLETDRHPATTT